MGVAELAFSIQLRLAHDQALRRRDVFDHPSQKILNKLERAYRSSELQTLLGILKRSLIGAHRASRRHPGNGVARHLQNFRGVAERVTTLEAVFFGHAAIFQVIWPFCTTLSATLFSILSTLKPGVVLFSTMKPLTWLSSTSRAQMIETSHHG